MPDVTPTLDELYRTELELLERLQTVRAQISTKQAQIDEARLRFLQPPERKGGRPPKGATP